MKVRGGKSRALALRDHSLFGIFCTVFTALSITLILVSALGIVQPLGGAEGESAAYLLATILVLQTLSYLAIYHHRRVAEEAEKRQLSYQIEAQAEFLKQLESGREEDKRIRHDFRQQIRMMSELANQGRLDALCAYMEATVGMVPKPSVPQLTANVQMDALLQYYRASAQDRSVEFRTNLMLPENLGVPMVQLSVVLGNLLENAVDAASTDVQSVCGNARPYVHVGAQVRNSQLIFVIDNSYTGGIWEIAGNFMSTKHKGRGVGITSARSAVKRLGGAMSCDYDEGVFHVLITLPMVGQEQSAAGNLACAELPGCATHVRI